MTIPARPPHLLRRDAAVLVVVDMQETFLRVVHDRERLSANVRLLLGAAALLRIPVLASVQYAQRLGPFAEDIAALLPTDAPPPVDKLSFSCGGSPEFMGLLHGTGRTQLLLCGVETHICVAQTALDLAAQDFQVHVAADAVSSRSLEKHKLGMERIRDSAVLPCAAEGAVYELLGAAGTPEFKSILALVR